MMQSFRALLASELFMRDPTNRQPSRGRGIVDWEAQNWGSNPRCETRGDQLSRNHVFQTFADGPSVRRLKDAQRLGLVCRFSTGPWNETQDASFSLGRTEERGTVIADRNGTMATARHRDPAVGHQPDAEAEREPQRV
jgi:hypothetical protein